MICGQIQTMATATHISTNSVIFTGLYGRWVKLRTYLELFPTYRRGMFRRQKAFQKSERVK